MRDWCEVLSTRRPLTWSIHIDRHLTTIDPLALNAAREFLTNAARHGHGPSVSAHLRSARDGIRVEVRNDGTCPDEIIPGTGLTLLRARLARRGGSLSVRPAPTGGTVATALIPAVALLARPEDATARPRPQARPRAAARARADRWRARRAVETPDRAAI
ncbi:ATP-binding protein [Patulibacter defluvii]|uniref:ATP-binding protein n=1 Tax=Patulibacter defluvii TaxID=3095358 RepID=UPI0035C8C60E